MNWLRAWWWTLVRPGSWYQFERQEGRGWRSTLQSLSDLAWVAKAYFDEEIVDGPEVGER